MITLNNVSREVSTMLLSPRAALRVHFVPGTLPGIRITIM